MYLQDWLCGAVESYDMYTKDLRKMFRTSRKRDGVYIEERPESFDIRGYLHTNERNDDNNIKDELELLV